MVNWKADVLRLWDSDGAAESSVASEAGHENVDISEGMSRDREPVNSDQFDMEVGKTFSGTLAIPPFSLPLT